MEKIYNCIKTDTGVSMDWMKGDKKNNEYFSFQELETMRIQVQDLVSKSELFRLDLQEHKIYVSQAGRIAL